MQIKTREQFPDLLNKLNLTGLGVEIGVQKGLYSAHLLKHWKGEKLYMIDVWRQFPGSFRADNPDPKTQGQHLLETFQNVYFYYDRATIIREFSVNASRFFPDNHFDFIYIDAAHDYQNVTEDLESWWPKLKPGGIIAGHDYFDGFVDFYQPDGTIIPEHRADNMVKSAVVDFFDCVNDVKFKINSTEEPDFKSWWVQK